MRLLFRFFGFLFAAGTILFLVAVGAISGLLWHFSQGLPDYTQLRDYEPPVMTRVHASDGSLIAEYAHGAGASIFRSRRCAKLVANAFISAEDKNFYEHNGLDFSGIMRPAACSWRTTARTVARRARRPSRSRLPRTSCSPTKSPSSARSRKRCSRMHRADLFEGPHP